MDEIRSNISKNILFHRKKNNFTQEQLAKLVDVKKTSVSSWERGANAPDIETLYKLCKIFGITLDDMYGDFCSNNNHHRKQNSICDYSVKLSDDEHIIVELFRKSDDQTKEMVKRLLSYKENV